MTRSNVNYTCECILHWYLPDEASRCDGGGCQTVSFSARSMGKHISTLQRTTDQFMWIKREITNRNTFIFTSTVLENKLERNKASVIIKNMYNCAKCANYRQTQVQIPFQSFQFSLYLQLSSEPQVLPTCTWTKG